MGRAPCCDKANVKKGPWSPEEDAKLKAFIDQHGIGGNWIALPQKIGLKRCGKSCRLRWLNYLRPNIKHGGFSEEEENIICNLYITIGSRWSIIAAQLPGRTDNDIKNYWNTRLKKKLLGKQPKEQQVRRACGLKQEMKKENENSIATDTALQNPYWPEPPAPMAMPYPYQDPHLSDHASFMKLLIKLGGRFSNNDQAPNIDSMNLHRPIENSISVVSPSPPMNSFTGTCSSLMNNPNSSPFELGDMIYSNPPKLEGLELDCYYGVSMKNGSNGTNQPESTSWGDIKNSVYPPLFSNYQGYQQGMLQECLLNDSRYMATQ